VIAERRRPRPRHEVALFMAALTARVDRPALQSWLFEIVTWCVRGDRRPDG
jgi:hypothetical protein